MYNFRAIKIILDGEEVVLKPKILPETPEKGYICLDSTDNKLKYYNGTKWIILALLSIQKDDTNQIDDISIINFEGNVEVTDEGNGKATINITSEYNGPDLGILTFGKNLMAQDVYLYQVDGISSSLTGYRMAKNGTIKSISWQCRNDKTALQDGYIHIRKNYDSTNIASLSITEGQKGNHIVDVDVDFNEGDKLQAYIENGKVNSIIVVLEFKWR
jgi:hypothetical protein